MVDRPVSSMNTSFAGSRSSCPSNQARRRFRTHEAFIVELIEARKDITLDEMVERLAVEPSVRISRSALSAWLGKRGWTFKKVRTCTGAGPPGRIEA
ncbi:putative insertion sequence transposase protein [Mesorhizobium amorphae CCNWGS0123]|uniref:Putative insertion sequence transposase protein n=1 Tax=Mesorhizobium amorphae CCNWGS0123 TaxID=1082933 RepID=G6YMC3_9HYPH|nr:putative insertion sequence transposase protein [Mesorhizobium amorphae CCNWGS0123]